MKELHKDIAYDAIAQLSKEFENLDLKNALETVLREVQQGGELSFYESIEKVGLAVAIAALVLQAASLGVDIHSLRLEDQDSSPKIEELEIKIRQQVTSNGCISLDQQDRIIQVVSEIIIQKAPEIKKNPTQGDGD